MFIVFRKVYNIMHYMNIRSRVWLLYCNVNQCKDAIFRFVP